MTRRQLSRHQREVRLQRIAIGAVAVAVVVALLIPLYGYWREVVAKGDQPIAVVRGETITTALYARFLGYQYALLQREAERVAEKAAKAEANSPEAQSAQLTLQVLQRRLPLLANEALDNLVEGQLVRYEAGQRGLNASPAELDAALQQEMSSYPLGGFRYQAPVGATTELLSLEQAREELQKLLARGKLLSEDEFRTLVLETQVLRGKVQAAIAASVKLSGEQVRARHILLETEEQARDVLARLGKGEDFAALAKELSKDNSNKEKGGELGWFSRGKMVKEFDDVAFALKPGELSQPTKTTFGYHVIQVEERSDDRPFEPDYVKQEQSKVFQEWLNAQRSDLQAVHYQSSQDKLAWAERYVAEQLKGSR